MNEHFQLGSSLFSTSTAVPVQNIVEFATECLESGRYKDGLEFVRATGFWDYKSPFDFPLQTTYSDEEYIDLLLCCAALYGYLGLDKNRVQDTAKLLLTRVLELSVKKGAVEKQLLALNYLALSESRVSAFDQATKWIDHSRALYQKSDAFLQCILTRSMIQFYEGDTQGSYDLLIENHSAFENCDNKYLSGIFYWNISTFKRNLNIDGVIDDADKALELFIEIKHGFYQISVINLKALYYFAEKSFVSALELAEEGLYLAMENGIHKLEGAILDTIAGIHLAQKEYGRAIDRIDESIRVLEATSLHGFLLTSFQTKIEILSEQGNYIAAMEVLIEAQPTKSRVSEKVGDRFAESTKTAIVAGIQKTIASKTHIALDPIKHDTLSCAINVPDQFCDLPIEPILVDHNNLWEFGFEKRDLLFFIERECETFDDSKLVRIVSSNDNEYLGKIQIRGMIVSLYFSETNYIMFERESVKSIREIVACCRQVDNYEFRPIEEVLGGKSYSNIDGDEYVETIQ